VLNDCTLPSDLDRQFRNCQARASGNQGERRAGRLALDVTLAFGQHEDGSPTHGYAATREAAMAAFAKSWRRK
jgi:hypothetical protein